MSSRFDLLGFVPAACAALVALGVPSLAAPAGGKRVLLRVDEALELAFPECEVKRGSEYLTREQRERVEELAGSKLSSGIAHPYVATKNGALVGTAYLDTHTIRTLKETILVVVDPQHRVGRIEILAFGEPDNYMARGEWYGQFVGKPLDDDLNLKRGIRGITGATLTARATTDAVRRVLALHSVLGPPPPPRK